MKRILPVILLGLMVTGTAYADIINVLPADWVGSRSTPSGSGLSGTGQWYTSTTPVASLSWAISESGGIYTYTYTFNHALGNTSHFILQISDEKALSDFTFTAGGALTDPTTYCPSDPGNSNPGLPGCIYGIKVTPAVLSTTTTVSFTTTLSPIWGSFYAKNGNVGGEVNALWNSGLSATANRPAAGTTVFTPWIAVPDGFKELPKIPEPGTAMLVGAGLLALGLLGRRRSSGK